MKNGSTWFLRGVIGVLAVIVGALCYVVLPEINIGWGVDLPHVAYLKYPVILGLSATAVAFYIALWQTFKLLNYVDKRQVFSAQSVKSLRSIKYCAFIISALYIGGLWPVYHVAQVEDAPGLILIGAFFALIAAGVGVFAGLLEKSLKNAIKIKSENELTV